MPESFEIGASWAKVALFAHCLLMALPPSPCYASAARCGCAVFAVGRISSTHEKTERSENRNGLSDVLFLYAMLFVFGKMVPLQQIEIGFDAFQIRKF